MKKIHPWFDYSYAPHLSETLKTAKAVTRLYRTDVAGIPANGAQHNGHALPSLLVDENIKRDIATAFRDAGCYVLSVHDAGLKGQPDPVLFEFAAENDLVLVTHDFDFLNANKYALPQCGGLIHLPSTLNERTQRAADLMKAILFDFSALLLDQIDTWKGTAVRYKTNGEVTIITSVPEYPRKGVKAAASPHLPPSPGISR